VIFCSAEVSSVLIECRCEDHRL